jgi:hydroxypyruvate isomerase
VNLSTVYATLPLANRPSTARAAGFDRIETWWPFDGPEPSPADVEAFCRAVEDSGTRLVAMNLYGGREGRRGVLSDPGEIDEFRASLRTTAAVADRLGTRLFNAPYGPELPAVGREAQEETAVANLAFAAAALTSAGTVLLEPLSSPNPGGERFPIRSLAQASALLDRSGADNVGLLFDQYHLEVIGFDLSAELARWIPRIRHVQIADTPSRGEPGSGLTDYDGFFGALARAGYRGDVALEFFPSPAADPLRTWRENRDAWAARTQA